MMLHNDFLNNEWGGLDVYQAGMSLCDAGFCSVGVDEGWEASMLSHAYTTCCMPRTEVQCGDRSSLCRPTVVRAVLLLSLYTMVKCLALALVLLLTPLRTPRHGGTLGVGRHAVLV